jgi:putative endonuclease
MSHLYIIYSKKLDRFYTGVTQGDVSERILKHNNQAYGTHRFTSTSTDWELFLSIEVDSYAHAVRLERKIKSQKSSKYIRNLKLYSELVNKIIHETM